jgi:putative transposase
LQLRAWRNKRRKMAVRREQRPAVTHPNHAWCMDFVADQLADGSKFRMLTILDIYTREALSIEVARVCAGNTWWQR